MIIFDFLFLITLCFFCYLLGRIHGVKRYKKQLELEEKKARNDCWRNWFDSIESWEEFENDYDNF